MSSRSMNVSPHAELGQPSEEWQEFFKSHQEDVPHLVGSPERMRSIMQRLKQRAQALVPPINDGLRVEDVKFQTFDNVSRELRIYTPVRSDEQSEPRNCVVYIHGGGWTLGDLEGEDLACRAMCVRASVVVVSVDYRLAPEYAFPTGLNDSWEALLWTRQNADRLGIDKERIVLGGSSSGGNTAAVLSQRARDQGLALKGVILRIPSVCHIDCYPPDLELHSLEELKNAPLLSKRSMELFYGYLNPPDPADPQVSPLLCKSFEGLAPTYMQVAGMDPLRDEGLAYAEKLRGAGVPVRLDIYPGLPHAFGYFPQLPTAAINSRDLIAGIEWLFQTEIGSR